MIISTRSQIVGSAVDAVKTRSWLYFKDANLALAFELAFTNNLEVLRDTLREAQKTPECIIAFNE